MITPGLKTSEFKVALAIVIGSIASGGFDWVANKWAFIGAVAGALGYVNSRGHAKSGNP